MILLIDNYDSFVYNLARYVDELGYQQRVFRNDKITLDKIVALQPSHIILSPGPCTPNEAGISMEIIQRLGPKIPILGVCLGHQAIGQVYGATISRAKWPRHGKASCITHDRSSLFHDMKNPQKVARYHSLVISDSSFPHQLLQVTARCEAGEIMAIKHRIYPVAGVQFHPESVLTESGHKYIENFLVIKSP